MKKKEALRALQEVVLAVRDEHKDCEAQPGACPWPNMHEEDVNELFFSLRRAGISLVRAAYPVTSKGVPDER